MILASHHKPTKTELRKFVNEVKAYQEYVENKRLLRWNPKTRKFVIVVYHPKRFYVQKFRQRYKKKYGVEYRSKKQKAKDWAKTRRKMNKQPKSPT